MATVPHHPRPEWAEERARGDDYWQPLGVQKTMSMCFKWEEYSRRHLLPLRQTDEGKYRVWANTHTKFIIIRHALASSQPNSNQFITRGFAEPVGPLKLTCSC